MVIFYCILDPDRLAFVHRLKTFPLEPASLVAANEPGSALMIFPPSPGVGGGCWDHPSQRAGTSRTLAWHVGYYSLFPT